MDIDHYPRSTTVNNKYEICKVYVELGPELDGLIDPVLDV